MATLMSYFAPPIAGEWGDEAEDNTDGVPVLRTTNFTADGRLSYDDLTYRSIDTEKKENKILQLGDIIIEKSGGTPKKPVGRCVYFDRDDEYDYFCSNFTAILRANTEEVNTKYLWYILQEHYKTRQCLKYQYKTNGIANLDIKDYLNHKEVELPPREVQDKRVKAMDYSQYLLDLHQELLDIMDNAVKSRFVEMFGDPMTNPMRWEIRNFGDIISKAETGWSGNGTQRKKVSGELAVLKISAVTSGQFREDEYKVLDDQENIKKKVFPRKGCLIVSRANTKDLVGASVLVEKDYDDLILPDKLWQFKFEKNVNVHYMKAVMSHEFIRSMVSQSSTGTSGSMYNISMEKYKMIEIPLPPAQLQDQFADFVALTDKSKLTIQKSMDNLQELRDSLLQEYFG